jgi:hypothetical protein
MGMRLGRLLPTLLVLAPLGAPAAAAASDFQQIFGDYKDNGQLNDCYRPEQIHNAGREIPPDIEQYAPGFGDALAAAQTRCAAGVDPSAPSEEEPAAPLTAGTGGAGPPGVEMKKTVREPPAPEPSASPVPAGLADPRLAPATAGVSGETPGALIALLIAAGLAVALALAWTLAWFMGWSPERLTKPLFAAFQTVWDRLLPGR